MKELNRDQQARWDNAVRFAAKINELLDRGYLVYILDGRRVENKIVVDDEEISAPFSDLNSGTILFRKDPEYDEGMWTTIKDWNKHMNVQVYAPIVEPISW